MLPPSSSLPPCKLDRDIWRTFIIILRWTLPGKRHFLNPTSCNVFSKLFTVGGGAIIIHSKISCIGYIFAY